MAGDNPKLEIDIIVNSEDGLRKLKQDIKELKKQYMLLGKIISSSVKDVNEKVKNVEVGDTYKSVIKARVNELRKLNKEIRENKKRLTELAKVVEQLNERMTKTHTSKRARNVAKSKYKRELEKVLEEIEVYKEMYNSDFDEALSKYEEINRIIKKHKRASKKVSGKARNKASNRSSSSSVGEAVYETGRLAKFNSRLGSTLAEISDESVRQLFAPINKFVKYMAVKGILPGRVGEFAVNAVAGTESMVAKFTAQGSALMAKIGIVGVILKKIYEVLSKMVKFSGVAAASLKLLSTITQLVIKPFADVVGSVMLPVLLTFLRAMLPFLRRWNDVMAAWSKSTSKHPELEAVQFFNTLLGMKQGGLFGAFAGALAPMLAAYGVNSQSTLGKILGLGSSLGIETLTLSGEISSKALSTLLGKVFKKVDKVNVGSSDNVMIKTAKVIIEKISGKKSGGGSAIETGGAAAGGSAVGSSASKIASAVRSVAKVALPVYMATAASYSMYKDASKMLKQGRNPILEIPRGIAELAHASVRHPIDFSKFVGYSVADILTFGRIDKLNKMSDYYAKKIGEYYSSGSLSYYNPLRPTGTAIVSGYPQPSINVSVNVNATKIDDNELLQKVYQALVDEWKAKGGTLG